MHQRTQQMKREKKASPRTRWARLVATNPAMTKNPQAIWMSCEVWVWAFDSKQDPGMSKGLWCRYLRDDSAFWMRVVSGAVDTMNNNECLSTLLDKSAKCSSSVYRTGTITIAFTLFWYTNWTRDRLLLRGVSSDKSKPNHRKMPNHDAVLRQILIVSCT